MKIDLACVGCLEVPKVVFFSGFGQFLGLFKEPIRSQIVLTKELNSQFIIMGLKVNDLEEKNDSIWITGSWGLIGGFQK